MNIENWTQRARMALQDSRALAIESGHGTWTATHLLHGTLHQEKGISPQLLRTAGVDVTLLSGALEKQLAQIPKVSGTFEPRPSSDLELLLAKVDTHRKTMGDQFVGVESLWLAATSLGKPFTQLFEQVNLTFEGLSEAINQIRKGRKLDSDHGDEQYGALDQYTHNLTALAEAGKLDPVIGRDQEIRRTLQVLSRRTKNNPILIGEPGVGKTAIVEGIAQRIASGDVPDSLRHLQVRSLDLAALVAGAKYRGEFEERLKGVLHDIEEGTQPIVLFIDEVHTLVGAGASEGAQDAANMLKPALARGTLHAIGATTLDEFRKHIEKDKALERRFQPVFVGEPSETDSISILRGLKERYEVHHGIRIQDPALVAAVRLSKRYIPDRFLPDKAIDLIDEAAARLKMEIETMPTEIDSIDRQLLRMHIEQEALGREKDDASKIRLEELSQEIASLQEERDAFAIVWQTEKERIERTRQLREQLEAARTEAERAERKGDLEVAARLRYGEIPSLERQLSEAVDAENDLGKNRFLREEVSAQDVASIVSRWTGIPVERMLQGERERLQTMEDHLKKRVVGQDHALSAIAHAVRRNRAGLADPSQPVGVFLFTGPTGVGKTETAKALAQYLFDDEAALVRIDMSEYMEKHSVSRLIGAPPGYVGYDEGGQLTERVRRRPYAVVLLDEIEKAAPEVSNVLLQVFDDGRLTDGRGRTVDFRNTVIIMTSNIGATSPSSTSDPSDTDEIRSTLHRYFRPEFINRIDEVITFNSLDRERIRSIVDIAVEPLLVRLASQDIHVKISNDAKQFIASAGWDPAFGARPLKRAIRQELENRIAAKIIDGSLASGQTLNIDISQGDLLVRTVDETEPSLKGTVHRQ